MLKSCPWLAFVAHVMFLLDSAALGPPAWPEAAIRKRSDWQDVSVPLAQGTEPSGSCSKARPTPRHPTGQQELAQAGAPSVSTLSIRSFDPRGRRRPASAVGAEPQTLRGHIGTGRRTAVRMRASRRQFCVRGARERCNHCPEGSRRWAETAGKTSRRRRALSRAGQVVCAGWVNGG